MECGMACKQGAEAQLYSCLQVSGNVPQWSTLPENRIKESVYSNLLESQECVTPP